MVFVAVLGHSRAAHVEFVTDERLERLMACREGAFHAFGGKPREVLYDNVISIETARSDMELLQAFATFSYPNAIGPGVWDIHSPRIPDAAEMASLLRRAAERIPPDRLW